MSFFIKTESFLISEELLKFIPLAKKKNFLTATDIFAISLSKQFEKQSKSISSITRKQLMYILHLMKVESQK
jgi:hypothetical protein